MPFHRTDNPSASSKGVPVDRSAHRSGGRGRSRRAIALTALVAASLALSACSSPASTSPALAGASSTGSGGTAKSITIFLIPSPTEDAIKARIPEFQTQTGITVKVVDAPYDDAHQKMLLSFQAKQGAYDVVQFDNPFLAPFASQNALTDLGPYTANSTAYDISDFVQPLQDYDKYNGVSVALNLSTEPFILWYRKDIYQKLGLSVPTTWDQYLSNAQKIQASGSAAGQVIANNSSVNSWWWLQLLWSYGGDMTDASGNVTVNTPQAIAATDYMKSLLAVSPKSAITATGDDATTLFTTQDVGQMINYSGYYPVIIDPKASKVLTTFDTAVIPKGVADVTELTGWNIGIPADSKAKGTAWQFLEWLLGKDNTPKLMDAGAAAIGRTSIVTNTAITSKEPYIALLGPAAQSGRRLPALTNWGQVSNQIGVAVQDILTGKTSTKDGLDALQAQLTATLGK
jgi:multiple sugar transport system substrate-binding protein